MHFGILKKSILGISMAPRQFKTSYPLTFTHKKGFLSNLRLHSLNCCPCLWEIQVQVTPLALFLIHIHVLAAKAHDTVAKGCLFLTLTSDFVLRQEVAYRVGKRVLLMFSAVTEAAGPKLISAEEKMRLVFRTPYHLVLWPCLHFNFWTSLPFSMQNLNLW